MVSPFLPDDEKVAAVRAALPAVEAGIYVNTGSVGPLPAETARAMADMADWELRVGRAHPDAWLDFLDRLDEARAAVAAILGADVGTIALTHSTTDGMNIAARGIDWRPGDRIVTTTGEHGGGLGPLVAIRAGTGAELAVVDVTGGDDEEIVARFAAAIDERTKLVALSHVTWSTGRLLPVERIAALARERGALVVVDGAQAAGAIPVDVGRLGVDAYAVSAQKWLLGPEGMGALWVAPGSMERLRPASGGHLSFERLAADGTAVAWPDARRYEATTFHRPSVVGFARSCGWLAMHVGLDWTHRRGTALASGLADRLAGLDGVEVLTPRGAMATLVTFRIGGWGSGAALDELAARTFVIARTVPDLDAIRFGPGFFNTDAEMDRLVEAVALLAGHTPDKLPPRRRLTVIGGGP